MKNKKIKFRVYDKTTGEIILHDSFFELQKWNRTKEEISNYIFNQYIGLKDTNEKEIFEGDVILMSKILDQFPKNDLIEIIGQVEWIEHDARFMINDTDNEQLYDFSGGTSNMKIIGNIYEGII